eukprot:401996-Rhodomonas_salina.1
MQVPDRAVPYAETRYRRIVACYHSVKAYALRVLRLGMVLRVLAQRMAYAGSGTEAGYGGTAARSTGRGTLQRRRLWTP